MKIQNFSRRLLALLLACVLSLACAPEALAASAEAQAQVMQLMKTEGTVTVSNSVKKSLTLLKNMRLYNGYHVVTDEASYAWVNLDSEKLLKMDAVSEISVRKNKKKLDVLLDSGNLFFNVTKPLEDEELFTIRTSTMAIGIRGTCGWVEVNDQRTMRVSVLEGTVSCTVTDPVTGQTKTESVSGGQTAICTVDGQTSGDNANIDIITLTEADVNGFALVELVGDGEMCDKILDDSGIDLRNLDGNARLKQDEADVHAKLSDINTKIGQQDKTVDTNTLKPAESEKPSTTTPTTNTSRPSYRPSAPSTPTETVTLTMPQTANDINAQLARSTVREVVVKAAESQLMDARIRAVVTDDDAADGILPDAQDNAAETTDPADPAETDGTDVTAEPAEPAQDGTDNAPADNTDNTDNTETPENPEENPAETPEIPDENTADNPENPENPEEPDENPADNPENPDETTDVPAPLGGDMNQIYVDTPLSVPAGKILTLDKGVSLYIPEQQSVQVAGNLTVGGALTNHGALTPVQGAVVKALKFDLAVPVLNWAESETADLNGYFSLDYTAPVPVTYTVTFDAKGGSVYPTSAQTGIDGKLTSLPTPAREGYFFNGWVTGQDGEGDKVDLSYVFKADTTVYAHWSENNSSIGGDNWAYDEATKTLRVWGNNEPMPDYDIYDQGGPNPPWKDENYKAETLIITGYTTIGDSAFNGGNRLTSITIPDGVTSIGRFAFAACGELPTINIPVSVTSIGRNAFSSSSKLTDVYYSGTRAQWNSVTVDTTGNDYLLSATIHCSDDGENPTGFVVTFDPNGGEGGSFTVRTNEAGRLTYLPTPSRNGYRFNGWFTEKGTYVSANTTFTGDAAVTARWTEEWEESDEYETKIRTEIVPVNRGLGRVNAYLTDGFVSSVKLAEYEGDAYAYLQRDYYSDVVNAHILEPRISFTGYTFALYNNSERVNYNGSNYKTIRMEIVPFAGESFSGDDLAVTATYYDYELQETRSLAPSATLASDKIVITCENPVPRPEDYSNNITFKISLNGTTYEVCVDVPAPYTYGGTSSTGQNWETRDEETWEGVLAALRETANTSGYWQIRYIGTTDVTLSESLTVAENQSLYLVQTSLTIADGGTLTAQGNNRQENPVNVRGTLTIDNGGCLAMEAAETGSSGSWQYVRSSDSDITVNGTVRISGNIYAELYTNRGNITIGSTAKIISNGQRFEINTYRGTLLAESGSQFTVGADSAVYLYASEGSVQFGGTMSGEGRVDFNGRTTVAETGRINLSYIYSSKGLINRGVLEADTVYFNNGLTNYGTIRVTGNQLSVSYTGHKATNNGEIQCEGRLYLPGTLLENRGTITGSGTVRCTENQKQEYDDGIERVEYDETLELGPDNYEHNKFVRDPGTTAEITYLIGELSNEGNGTCSLQENN